MALRRVRLPGCQPGPAGASRITLTKALSSQTQMVMVSLDSPARALAMLKLTSLACDNGLRTESHQRARAAYRATHPPPPSRPCGRPLPAAAQGPCNATVSCIPDTDHMRSVWEGGTDNKKKKKQLKTENPFHERAVISSGFRLLPLHGGMNHDVPS